MGIICKIVFGSSRRIHSQHRLSNWVYPQIPSASQSTKELRTSRNLKYPCLPRQETTSSELLTANSSSKMSYKRLKKMHRGRKSVYQDNLQFSRNRYFRRNSLTIILCKKATMASSMLNPATFPHRRTVFCKKFKISQHNIQRIRNSGN